VHFVIFVPGIHVMALTVTACVCDFRASFSCSIDAGIGT